MDYLLLFLCVLVNEAILGIGAVTAKSSVRDWYRGLDRPWYTPNKKLFQAISICTFALMGASLYFLLVLPDSTARSFALFLFAGQLFFNLMWNLGMFHLRDLYFGMAAITFNLIMIAYTIYIEYLLNPIAAYLLAPIFIEGIFIAVNNYVLLKRN